MRGLKHVNYGGGLYVDESHPSWVRGLKRSHAEGQRVRHTVAPLVGAWIETNKPTMSIVLSVVAPLVGAWIETSSSPSTSSLTTVAPLVGAWIETYYSINGSVVA